MYIFFLFLRQNSCFLEINNTKHHQQIFTSCYYFILQHVLHFSFVFSFNFFWLLFYVCCFAVAFTCSFDSDHRVFRTYFYNLFYGAQLPFNYVCKWHGKNVIIIEIKMNKNTHKKYVGTFFFAYDCFLFAQCYLFVCLFP